MAEADAAGVEALAHAVLRVSPHYNDEAKRHLADVFSTAALEAHGKYWPESVILARHEGRLVGFSLASRFAGAIDLQWVMVDPSARHLRVGPRLYDTIVKQARYYACAKVWGVCRTTNAGVARHVVRQGGRVVGTLHKHAFGQDYLLWEHLLD